jgi:hypothetical protein
MGNAPPPHSPTAPVGGASPPRFSTLLAASLLAAIIITSGTLLFLSKNLPDPAGETLHYPASEFKFAFGSGQPKDERMLVNEFANSYALLTSGPVSIQADAQRALNYTWRPPKMPQEAAFFWRRSDDTQNVHRTDITVPGKQLIDLATEPNWRGEITELGFLVAGVNGETVEIGHASLLPDNLATRVSLTWRAWAIFEAWSQQSINFLQGGDYRQTVSLPLLVAAWLFTTLLLFWLFTGFGKNISSRQLLITAGLVFLFAWVVLDIRWSANNLRQITLSFQQQRQADDQQRAGAGQDGEIHQYIQRLKGSVLGDKKVRILILGDKNASDYFLLKAKYHLLPHSVDVAAYFAKGLTPESVDFVLFFGQANGIAKVRGWNRNWQQSLVKIDQGEWGIVYRVE